MAQGPSRLTQAVTQDVQKMLSGDPSPQALENALRHLAKWRARVLENTLLQTDGDAVQTGPFKGMRYADVAEFISLSHGSKGAEGFAKHLKSATTGDIPQRAARIGAPLKMTPVETLYFLAPNYAAECWKRKHFGMAAHSICGVTHTTATQAVMQGFHDLRAAPQAPWDAVTCSS